MIEEQAKDFLMAEFSTAWQQVLNIDVRRGIFFNYYNIAFLAVLTFAAGTLEKSTAPSPLLAWALTAVFVLLIAMGYAVIGILESERAANVRYRNKINLIRETFLSDLDDPKIKFYMQQKDIGIKDFTTDKESIDAMGRTLKGIYRLICIERGALIIMIGIVWWGYFSLPEITPGLALDACSAS